jgi:glycosyltransferase involved in cell wall biosynthesis
MPAALVTVSGDIPPDLDQQIAAGRRPRADYRELATALDADVVDVATATSGRLGRLLRRVGGGPAALAWHCVRHRKQYDVVLTDAEPVGFLLALLMQPLRRRPRHVMVAHRLSPPKKLAVHRLLRLRRRIDGVIVYAGTQRDVAVDQLGYRPDQVLLTPFMVDTAFWTPPETPPAGRPTICAVGQELRDYPTMADAVRDLPADVVLAAASPWSKRRDTAAGIDVPANVTVSSFDLSALRDLYRRSSIVVVPLEETDFQAGITTILEAMSVGLPIVCTRTIGQTDTLVDGVTGVYVPPGDAAALRAAVERLLASDSEAGAIGHAARVWAVEHADIERYAERLARFARIGEGGGR